MHDRNRALRMLMVFGLGVLLGVTATALWMQRIQTQSTETVVAGAATADEPPDFASLDASAPTTFVIRDGMSLVGTDLAPGRYVTRGAGAACYFAVTSDLSGSLRSVVTTYFDDAFGRRVELAVGQYFETDECGRWILEAVPSTGEDQ
ncbi:hypothetical protein [Candidatus Poriferisodalis sp.]|uniref:hypothetical protein n=1 Tax=Candidatus Poriferisodalis sp. TaxID=3101277 RepID=UPI003D11545F